MTRKSSPSRSARDDVERRDDVRVADARGEARLVEEHRDELGIARRALVQALDRDGAREAARRRAAAREWTVAIPPDAISPQSSYRCPMTLKRARVFLIHWTLAVVAAALAFVVHLAMRGRTVSLGYELGKARQEQARLREVKRVHELEAASYKTPERVEIVARSLLGMEPPGPDRIVPDPCARSAAQRRQAREEGPHAKADP